MDQTIKISQSVAILVDGNNIERSLHGITGDDNVMLNFDTMIPRLIEKRGLNRLGYFREGQRISSCLLSDFIPNTGSVILVINLPIFLLASHTVGSKVDTIIKSQTQTMVSRHWSEGASRDRCR